MNPLDFFNFFFFIRKMKVHIKVAGNWMAKLRLFHLTPPKIDSV